MTDNNGSVQTLQFETQLVARVQACLKCWSQQVRPHEHQAKAWDQFYRSYCPLIRRVAADYQLSKSDEEDCFQHIWQKLLQILPQLSFDPARGTIRNWLTTVVRRLALKFVQKLRQRQAKITIYVSNWKKTISVQVTGPVDRLQTKEKIRMVQQMLQQLRSRLSLPSYRVFHMRWMEGQSFDEIAKQLDLTPQQARWRHHRAKQKAKELLALTMQSDLD